jgi:SAM-dependent methyltransferase
MDQVSYWNRVAEEKTFTLPVSDDLMKKLFKPSSCILEIGCGQGRILKQLQKEGFINLHGIDSAEKMVALAHENVPTATVQVTEGTTIPYENDYFDAILLVAVLTCITDDGIQYSLIKEAERVLKPGGIIYVQDYLVNDDKRNRIRYKDGKKRFGTYGVFELEEGALLRHHSRRHIKDLLGEFRTLFFDKALYRTMNGNESRGFRFVGTKRDPQPQGEIIFESSKFWQLVPGLVGAVFLWMVMSTLNITFNVFSMGILQLLLLLPVWLVIGAGIGCVTKRKLVKISPTTITGPGEAEWPTIIRLDELDVKRTLHRSAFERLNGIYRIWSTSDDYIELSIIYFSYFQITAILGLLDLRKH